MFETGGGGLPYTFLKCLLTVRMSELTEKRQTPGMLPRAFHLGLGGTLFRQQRDEPAAKYIPQFKSHTILAL